MRVLGSLLEIVKAAVRQHLGPPLFSLDFVPALLNPAVKPTPIKDLYTGFAVPLERARLVLVDLDATPFQRCIRLHCDNETSYRIGAMLLPEVPGGVIQTFITTDRHAIIVVQTDAAVHPDGTVQIYGAETGLTVMTIERRHAEHRKALVKGDTVRAFSYEVLEEGAWQHQDVPTMVPRELVKDITEDD